MADVEASTAGIVGLDDGGHFLVVTDTGPATPKRLAVDDVAAGVTLAETAIQPVDLGTAAYASTTDFAPMSIVAEIEAGLDAILAGRLMAIGEKLQLLKEIQRDLRTAIESKGIVVGDAPFEDYPGFVTSIVGGPADTTVSLGGESVTLHGALVTIGA